MTSKERREFINIANYNRSNHMSRRDIEFLECLEEAWEELREFWENDNFSKVTFGKLEMGSACALIKDGRIIWTVPTRDLRT